MKQRHKYREAEQRRIAEEAINNALEEEIKRIAYGLHDGLGGLLSSVKINLDNVEYIENARELIKKSIDELRRISHNLMPPALQYGIKAALEEFCFYLPQVQFNYYGDNSMLNEKMNLTLYRCAFELINNASGIDLCAELKILYPSLKVVMLTMFTEIIIAKRSLACGALGYMLKDSDIEDVIECIETVSCGETYICESIALKLKTVLEEIIWLTKREKEVLQNIAKGFSDKEIAKELGIGYHRVRELRQILLQKFNVNTSIKLVEKAKRQMYI